MTKTRNYVIIIDTTTLLGGLDLFRESVKESVVQTVISLLKDSEGMFGLDIRQLQPSTSAQNIVTEITKLGHHIDAVDLGVDILYTYEGLYED